MSASSQNLSKASFVYYFSWLERSWMNERRVSEEYEKKIDEFLWSACQNEKAINVTFIV